MTAQVFATAQEREDPFGSLLGTGRGATRQEDVDAARDAAIIARLGALSERQGATLNALCFTIGPGKLAHDQVALRTGSTPAGAARTLRSLVKRKLVRLTADHRFEVTADGRDLVCARLDVTTT